jgi:hypothetical protein
MEANLERERNQREFRGILAEHGITQAQAADLITKETFRVVNPRTVRAWLAQKAAKTATPCPKWAIVALKKSLVTTIYEKIK